MTSIKKIAGALALLGVVGGAQAAAITNSSGTYSFSGFDWDKFGSVRISGYDLKDSLPVGTTDQFNLTYQAFATGVYDQNGDVLSLGGLRQGTGSGFEYTIVVNTIESATLLSPPSVLNPAPGVSIPVPGMAALNVLGGTFDIYYQAVGDANRVAGTGYMNGTRILGGMIRSSFVPGGSNTILAAQGASNPGNVSLSASLVADVTFQDFNFVTPALVSSIASTTLQFGSTIDPQWVRPGQIGGVVIPGSNSNTDFVGQADGNQSFVQKVPEPASAALLGLALAGLGMTRRSKKAN